MRILDFYGPDLHVKIPKHLRKQIKDNNRRVLIRRKRSNSYKNQRFPADVRPLIPPARLTKEDIEASTRSFWGVRN